MSWLILLSLDLMVLVSFFLESLTFLGIFKMIFNLAKATHCSPGRAMPFVCEAMRSFLVSTVVTQ